jgi:hypothetical protein
LTSPTVNEKPQQPNNLPHRRNNFPLHQLAFLF